MIKRLSALILALMLLLALVPAVAEESVCILFTHDMHSHLTPTPTTDGLRGGFARLKTLIDREKAAAGDALVLDAGDFSSTVAVDRSSAALYSWVEIRPFSRIWRST